MWIWAKKRTFLLWLGMFAVICLCTGCWDATEVDRLSIVSMSGADIGADGKSVRASLQIPLPSQLGTTGGGAPATSTGSTQAYVVESADGETAMDALETLRRRLSRRLFMGHRRVLVVGEAYARKGVASLMDEIVRNPDSRLRTYVVVAYHTDADSILRVPYPLNRLPADAIVELQEQGNLPPIDARMFIRSMGGYGDPAALGISLISEDQAGAKSTFALNRMAVFRGDRLAGWLQGDAFDGYVFIDGRIRSANTSVQLSGNRGAVSARCTSLQSKRSIVIEQGHPRIRIEVQAVYDVSQNASALNLNDPENVGRLQSALEQKVKGQMQSTMTVLQHRYRSDPFDFADMMHEYHPRQWRQLEHHWREVYARLPVDYVIHAQVRNSGQINVPLRSDGGT